MPIGHEHHLFLALAEECRSVDAVEVRFFMSDELVDDGLQILRRGADLDHPPVRQIDDECPPDRHLSIWGVPADGHHPQVHGQLQEVLVLDPIDGLEFAQDPVLGIDEIRKPNQPEPLRRRHEGEFET